MNDVEYTLEVWDGVIGAWHAVDSSSTLDDLDDAECFNASKWRIVKTEVILKSYGA